MQPDGGQNASHGQEADAPGRMRHPGGREHGGQGHDEQPHQDEEMIWLSPSEEDDSQAEQKE